MLYTPFQNAPNQASDSVRQTKVYRLTNFMNLKAMFSQQGKSWQSVSTTIFVNVKTLLKDALQEISTFLPNDYASLISLF